MSDQAIVIFGEVLWDQFPDGPVLGGAPSNVAWHLGLAGGWARIATRVGDDDLGRRAVARLAEVCDVSLVQIDPERATGEVEVALEAGEPRYRMIADRAWERITCTADVVEAVGEAGVLVFGTLAQRTPEGLAGWRATIAAAREGCLKVCDLNLRRNAVPSAGERAAYDAALGECDVLKVNDRELDAIGGWLGARDPVAALQGRGISVVAVTHGARGSTLHGETGTHAIEPIVARTGGDNVGCGDAYLAILVHGLTLGWDLPACGRAASRWAAAVAEHRGATPFFDEARVEQLLGEAA